MRYKVKNPDMKLLPKTFTPMERKIVVQAYEYEQTEGGVLLPDNSKQNITELCEALVVAAGPDCKQVKRGDKVLFFPNQPCGVGSYKGAKLLFLQEEAVIGVVDHEQ